MLDVRSELPEVALAEEDLEFGGTHPALGLLSCVGGLGAFWGAAWGSSVNSSLTSITLVLRGFQRSLPFQSSAGTVG